MFKGIKRHIEYGKRENNRSNVGWFLIKDMDRYEYEMREFRVFLSNIKNLPICENYIDYLDFFIDLLKQEVKYSSLMEINRGNSRDRFIYPFFKFNLQFFGVKDSKTKISIDVDKNLISSPWRHDRYARILRVLKKEKFKYDESNHMAIHYDYLDITCAYNGLHSLGVASCLCKGTIEAEYYDTAKIFSYIDVNEDLSFSYNIPNVEKYLSDNNIDITARIKNELQLKVYGTDYRLLLIYKLSQEKFELEKHIEKMNE